MLRYYANGVVLIDEPRRLFIHLLRDRNTRQTLNIKPIYRDAADLQSIQEESYKSSCYEVERVSVLIVTRESFDWLMEHGFPKNLQDKTECIKNEYVESSKSEQCIEHNLADEKGGYKGDSVQVRQEVASVHEDVSGEINIEASLSAGDVARAGGFGARDSINSFLPVASDSTDFEAALLDARDYEEPQQEIRRPGLGWTEAKN